MNELLIEQRRSAKRKRRKVSDPISADLNRQAGRNILINNLHVSVLRQESLTMKTRLSGAIRFVFWLVGVGDNLHQPSVINAIRKKFVYKTKKSNLKKNLLKTSEKN